ncbi:hypothetical protein GWL_24190 [Herbaspirillum sp. GW103]|nr:hypothetical protein GWL_24190 [Herbaspirillum sp. GW103]
MTYLLPKRAILPLLATGSASVGVTLKYVRKLPHYDAR